MIHAFVAEKSFKIHSYNEEDLEILFKVILM